MTLFVILSHLCDLICGRLTLFVTPSHLSRSSRPPPSQRGPRSLPSSLPPCSRPSSEFFQNWPNTLYYHPSSFIFIIFIFMIILTTTTSAIIVLHNHHNHHPQHDHPHQHQQHRDHPHLLQSPVFTITSFQEGQEPTVVVSICSRFFKSDLKRTKITHTITNSLAFGRICPCVRPEYLLGQKVWRTDRTNSPMFRCKYHMQCCPSKILQCGFEVKKLYNGKKETLSVKCSLNADLF